MPEKLRKFHVSEPAHILREEGGRGPPSRRALGRSPQTPARCTRIGPASPRAWRGGVGPGGRGGARVRPESAPPRLERAWAGSWAGRAGLEARGARWRRRDASAGTGAAAGARRAAERPRGAPGRAAWRDRRRGEAGRRARDAGAAPLGAARGGPRGAGLRAVRGLRWGRSRTLSPPARAPPGL